MEELRHEIKAAFEREQLASPPVAVLRRNVVANVVARPHQQVNLQRLAAVVAIMLTIAIVGGLLSSRLAYRSPVPVIPQPATEKDYGPPPAGVPLVYAIDPRNKAWLQGFDWHGQPRGTVKLDQPLESSQVLRMAPDGSAFQLGPVGKGGVTYLDRLGQPMPGSASLGGKGGGMWADDLKHLCIIDVDFQTFVWSLSTQLPGEAARPVAAIAQDQGIGQTGISLAACSFRNDFAILVRTTIWWPIEIWVVRISDGRVLSHHSYEQAALVTVVSSPDGAYLAESSAASQHLGTQPGPNTIIRRVSDWSVVATMDPAFQALDFSGDGSLVLVTTQGGTGTAPTHLAVIDWRSGQLVWGYDGPESLYRHTPQPDGREFALAFRAPTQLVPSPCGSPQTACRTVEDPLDDLVIVHGDGTVTKIPGRYLTAW